MHENRETSDAPASSNGRTAGEGSGRNARVYAPEESDSGIVPMSHSNKIEQSMAESEEGRPLIEENTLVALALHDCTACHATDGRVLVETDYAQQSSRPIELRSDVSLSGLRIQDPAR